MNNTYRDGSIEDLLDKKICGATFCGENGLTLHFSDGSNLLLADATRRGRIFVMLSERAWAEKLANTQSRGSGGPP